ncbi:hypothetical protein BJ165DRAFT_1406569 [Panaeolus papilionaceus]|nr:hypothetical protein BJ165DRAFT_1406569 [Panaeolus papilionaceus]
MSIKTRFELQDAVKELSLEPIVLAVDEVMQDLSPLVNSKSGPSHGLDESVALSLKDALMRFVKAVQYMLKASQHTHGALIGLCTLLDAPMGILHLPSVISDFQKIAEDFLCGHSSAIDGHNTYTYLKREVDDQFRIALETYGLDPVVQVTERGNTMQISLRQLRSTVAKHLVESEKSSSDMLRVLAGINVLLQNFLEDERFSLSKPLITAPIFSRDTFQTWNTLRNEVLDMEFHLKPLMERYKVWFNWSGEDDDHSALEVDRKIRREKICQPKIKIQVPKQPGPSTADIVVARLPYPSGECRVRVDRINHICPGVTEVKVVVDVPRIGSWFQTKSFEIFCAAELKSATLSLVSVLNKSPTLKDITGDPSFEPKDSRPRFKVEQPSPWLVFWVFSRPFPLIPWRSPSAFPTQIAVTFRIKHDVLVDLQLGVTVNDRFNFPFNFWTSGYQTSGGVLISPNYNFKQSAGIGEPPPTCAKTTNLDVNGLVGH